MENQTALTMDSRSEVVRNLLLDTLIHQYSGMVTTIQKMPLATEVKTIILQSFGTGYLWAKDAIGALNFDAKPQQPNLEVIESDNTQPLDAA